MATQLIASEDRDKVVAQVIFDTLVALLPLRATEPGLVNRLARELVQKTWQEARMPRPRVAHNKPHAFPWSPAARSLVHSGESLANKLVLDHAIPASVTRESLFAGIVSGEIQSGADMERKLHELHDGVRFVIITREEDQRLSAAGLRQKPPTECDCQPDQGHIYCRYLAGLNLTEKDFQPLYQDNC